MGDPPNRAGLHDASLERDACGVGLVVDRTGRSRRAVLPLALTALARLSHRGAVDADGRTGDGAGVITAVPHELLAREAGERGLDLPRPGHLATGLLFLPPGDADRRVCRAEVERILTAAGFPRFGWRKPPLDFGRLGEKARRSSPAILQLWVERPRYRTDEQFEEDLFLARKRMERRLARFAPDRFCVVSLSHRTMVYKGLVRGVDLSGFYRDLADPLYDTAFAVFHQRYSTNSSPSWRLAQPFRVLAHNGEINTIAGNRARMRASEAAIRAAGGADRALLPLLDPGGSDSAHLDNAAELLVRRGRSLPHALSMLIPPAWENDDALDPEVRACHEHHAALSEPWDGPALVVYADGVHAGASMDRNGLRPARTVETRDGLFLLASEAGVAAVDPSRVARRARLGPGDMVAVELSTGELEGTGELRRRLARQIPGAAREAERPRIAPATRAATTPPTAPDAVRILKAFGYTAEEMRLVLGPLYGEGREAIASMGDDSPLAVLARRRLLFSYFKQRFAQVTNPPMDPLRETLVMSLDVWIGPRDDLFSPVPQPSLRIRLPSPLLSADGLSALLGRVSESDIRRMDATFPAAGGAAGFSGALARLASTARDAVESGAWLLVLSDRSIGADRVALPSLLATAAVHQTLVRAGLRPRSSIVCETGEARDEHQIAALLAFGADAVHPWLAPTVSKAATGNDGGRRPPAALEKGLAKILSKMGISAMRSYLGAGLFEAIGLSAELVDSYFPGAGSPIGGIGVAEIAAETVARHAAAFASDVEPRLPEGGFLRFRREGEAHAFSPDVVKALRQAASTGEAGAYTAYSERVRTREPLAIRDLFEFASVDAVALDEVEAVEEILRRFTTSAMSIGALSPEAHETLAVAMNRIGARSNSGEGGADPRRFRQNLPSGDCANDRIKQIASARFGVTADYLMSAEELQIKMAQGSKPGEGGQLPGAKVTPEIARLRRCPDGTTLISPPPHHDIYSIEDLAELIYDVKRVSPTARVGVKVVSTSGIGTIATGVAKAFADSVLVSGHDGGTGASPLSSIKNAGMPWELGLAETQQALVSSGLRGRIRVQVDGGLKTGRDVVVAALLGAEEYGFGTAALVAAGCVMARQCHANTCPAGIATQREDLRAKFPRDPEPIVRFFTAVAGEVRGILASIGCRSLEEAVGRTDLLRTKTLPPDSPAAALDLSRLVPGPALPDGPRRCVAPGNDPPPTGADLDGRAIEALREAKQAGTAVALHFPISNRDRAVGARIAGELSDPARAGELPRTVVIRYDGEAGQSLGAFCVDGMRLSLRGEANDHVGKGMSGGHIAIAPAGAFPRPAPGSVLAGNAVLYGATGGSLWLAGRAGERFAVRNSGATAVVEGLGDHGCEYMTAGCVVVLGPVGRNFAAGMSGGTAYVLDSDGTSSARVNSEMVRLGALDSSDAAELRGLVAAHRDATGSERARELLDHWAEFLPLFVKVSPVAAVRPAAIAPAVPEAAAGLR
jgi:glutamate synthase (ferredoxin)